MMMVLDFEMEVGMERYYSCTWTWRGDGPEEEDGVSLELDLRIMLGPHWSWRRKVKQQSPVHLPPHPSPTEP